MKMTLETELRPCYFVGNDEARNGLFHCWSHKSNVIEPSPMTGGHPGSVISYTVGIIELDNGKIIEAMPEQVLFIDNKMREYDFSGGNKNGNE